MEEKQHTSEICSNSNSRSPLLHKDEENTSSEPTAPVILTTLVAISGSFVFGSSVGFSSPAEAGMISDIGLTLAQYSVFGSILTIGAMIGAIVSGRIADRFGRRGVMAVSELLCIAGSLAIIFTKVAWLLDVARLLIGIGIGILSYVVPVYVAEITPKNLRGSFTAAHQLMICFGVSTMWLLGTIIHWRILALIGIIPSILQFLGAFFIPESPRWLVGFSSPAEAGMISDLGLTLAQYSVFGSILTIGAMIGAIVSGRIADRFGRRGVMAVSELLCIAGNLAIIYAKVAWLLNAARLLIGIGIGILSYVVPVYVAEITPKNLRGSFTAAHQLMICFGLATMWLLGIIIHWRILALIGIIPSILQFLGAFFIPESPRWLAKNSRWEECEDVLKGKISDLFQREYSRSLIVGVGLMLFQQFGGVNGVIFYATSIFKSAGFSGQVGTLSMVAIKVPMTVAGTLLMDKSGRRPLLMISAAGTCLGCFLTGLSFLFQDLHLWNTKAPVLALVGVLVRFIRVDSLDTSSLSPAFFFPL